MSDPYCEMEGARTESEARDEIQITPEMLSAGELELAVRCDPFALISSITFSDLRALYIAMRMLEPENS
jgi:hypothetical protein